MPFFLARKLQSNSAFTFIRRGHAGPSRLRLKRQDKCTKEAMLEDEPYIFHPRVRTVEPVHQALRITKSIVKEGLPSSVLSEMNNLPFDDILPQIKHTLLNSGAEHNAKYVQRSKGVIMNVVKAIWSCAARYPGLLQQTMSYKPDLKVSWKRFGYNLQVSGRNGLLLSSECALPSFASNTEVENTIEMAVEKKDELISPVFELSQNVSGQDMDRGFYYDVFPFPQTLVITESNWNLQHLIAQGIMFSFGRLLERAVSQGRLGCGHLMQQPLSIRSVVSNDQVMAVLCYQLNTLDFDNNEGVKNQLWLSQEFPISFDVSRHDKNKDKNVDCLELPEQELKELVALFLYGEHEENVMRSFVM